MKEKLNFGIEISKNVETSAVPSKIRRYDTIQKRVVKPDVPIKNNMFYQYRPVTSSFTVKKTDV